MTALRRRTRHGAGTLRLLAQACLWALLMAASAGFSIARLDWQNSGAIGLVVALFALGALIAYAPAVIAARLVAGGARRDTPFATFMVALAGFTIGITALLFGLYYRHYYAHWHDPAFTVVWVFQYLFTVAAAIYHFSVLGIRLYVPIGLPALLAFSWWHARRTR